MFKCEIQFKKKKTKNVVIYCVRAKKKTNKQNENIIY